METSNKDHLTRAQTVKAYRLSSTTVIGEASSESSWSLIWTRRARQEGRLPLTGSDGALAPASGTLQHIVQYVRISGYYILTYIAHDIVPDVVIRYPYIPILCAFYLRYRLVFFDIVVDIGWQGFWVLSVLISYNDIGYYIVGFSLIL